VLRLVLSQPSGLLLGAPGFVPASAGSWPFGGCFHRPMVPAGFREAEVVSPGPARAPGCYCASCCEPAKLAGLGSA